MFADVPARTETAAGTALAAGAASAGTTVVTVSTDGTVPANVTACADVPAGTPRAALTEVAACADFSVRAAAAAFAAFAAFAALAALAALAEAVVSAWLPVASISRNIPRPAADIATCTLISTGTTSRLTTAFLSFASGLTTPGPPLELHLVRDSETGATAAWWEDDAGTGLWIVDVGQG